MLHFDESLAALVEGVRTTLGEKALDEGVAVRDAAGHLSFVTHRIDLSEDQRALATKAIAAAVGRYARPDRVLVFGDDPGAEPLLRDTNRLYFAAGGYACAVLDRRIVGTGWMRSPSEVVANPPRVVFASLKGGVGRSTALSVAAMDLAARGSNVLVLDLDLEAPGLGDLLLGPDRTPRYGVVDYLVEGAIGELSDTSLEDFVGTSPMTLASGGRVDVLPALGLASKTFPENVLPKIARAMTDIVDAAGNLASVGTRLSDMIGLFAARQSYDAVLIDSRAGLAELTAPAILNLGALVLLFGTAQEQTLTGYRAMFAALKLLAIKDISQGAPADWRLMLRPVYAKASLDPSVGARHRDELYELFSENLYDEAAADSPAGDSVYFDADDPAAPHAPLVIPFDPRFVDFDPLRSRDQLASAFFEQTYRPFLDSLYAAVDDLAASRSER